MTLGVCVRAALLMWMGAPNNFNIQSQLPLQYGYRKRQEDHAKECESRKEKVAFSRAESSW